MHADEPLMVEDESRISILPIQDAEIWQLYKTMEANQWISQEIDFEKDFNDWRLKLSAGDRAYYELTFSMFVFADEVVIANIGERLMQDIRLLECRYYFAAQGVNEQVHSESYAQQVAAVFPDEAERARVIRAVETMPVIAKLRDWAHKWMDPALPLGVRLTGWAMFEGVLFQGQFMGLQLLKSRGLLPGVTMLNEFIGRDEGLHCAAACFLVRSRIKHKPSVEQFHQIVREVVDLYDEFSGCAIARARAAEGLPPDAPCPVMHISEGQMREYIRHIADVVTITAGYPKIYNAKNPYPEAAKQSLNEVCKANFFEHESTQYNMRADMRIKPQAGRCQKIGFCCAPAAC